MNILADMIWIELRKALRSPMPLFTTLGSMFLPLGMAFLVFISRNPEVSRQLGLITAKAELLEASATNWPTYLSLFAQALALGGIFLFILIISWVFGREFTDHTLKDLLAVPVPRTSIVLAKFIVAGVWSAALALVISFACFGLGSVMGLPEGSASVLREGMALLAVTAGLVITSVMPFAFFASLGRGFLLPLGVAFLTLVAANLAIVAGWGETFPWSVPGLLASRAGTGAQLPAASYWIVVLTGLAGVVATALWWKYSDQAR